MGSRTNKVFKAPWASGGKEEETLLPDSQSTPFSMSQRWVHPFTYDKSQKGKDVGNGWQSSRQQSEGSQLASKLLQNLHEKSGVGSLLALRAHDVGGANVNSKFLGDAVEKLQSDVAVVKGTLEDLKKRFEDFETVLKEKFDCLAVEVGKCVESVARGDGVQRERNRSSDAIISRIVKAVLQRQETLRGTRPQNKDEGRRREYAGGGTSSLLLMDRRPCHHEDNEESGDGGVRKPRKRIKRVPSFESCSSARMG